MSKRFKITATIQADEDVNESWLEDLLRDCIHEQEGLLVEKINTEEIYE